MAGSRGGGVVGIVLFVVGGGLALGGLAGCSSLSPDLQAATSTMDEVAAGIEEYGTVTISSPVLSQSGERFKFELSKSPDDYYNAALTNFQGRAADLEQVISSFGFGAPVAYDPLIAAQYAAQVGEYYQAQA